MPKEYKGEPHHPRKPVKGKRVDVGAALKAANLLGRAVLGGGGGKGIAAAARKARRWRLGKKERTNSDALQE